MRASPLWSEAMGVMPTAVKPGHTRRILLEAGREQHVVTEVPLMAQMVKNLPADAGHSSSIPRSGRSPGGGHGYQLQYSCLENPMDRGAWWATVHGVTKSRTRPSD